MQKRLNTISTIVLLIFVLGLCACSGNSIKMELKPKVGEVLKYRTKMTQKMGSPMGEMNMSATIDTEQKTVKVSEKEIEYSTKFISGSMSMNGKSMKMPKVPDQKIVMDKRGRVIKTSDNGTKFNFPMPENKVKVGDTWKNSDKVELDRNTVLNIDCTYKLAEIKKENGRDIAVIDSVIVGETEKDGTKMKCEGSGQTKFDYTAGLLVGGEVKQKITISKGDQSIAMDQEVICELIK